MLILILGTVSLAGNAQQPRSGFDIHILYELKKTRSPLQTSFFRTISDINNPVCLGVPAALFLIGWIRKIRARRLNALQVIETIALSQTLSFSLKLLFGRLRPQLWDTSFVPIVYAINKSFPSGHTTEAFAMATALTLIGFKWYIILPAYTWAVLIAYSRMYLGVHFPTDILGGILLGTVSSLIIWRINKWIRARKREKDQAEISV